MKLTRELLAPQQKLAYKLCHQDGLTYEEAAMQMNISIETGQMHLVFFL